MRSSLRGRGGCAGTPRSPGLSVGNGRRGLGVGTTISMVAATFPEIIVDLVDTFFKRFYASTTAPRPDVEPFFLWYRKTAATPNGTFESD